METIKQVKSDGVIKWKNGDECVFDNKTYFEFSDLTLEYLNQTAKVHCQFNNKHGYDMVLIEFSDGYCCASRTEAISKPETETERNERERIEAAYELYCIRCDAINWRDRYTFDEFKSEPDAKLGWLSVVNKTNYRKSTN